MVNNIDKKTIRAAALLGVLLALCVPFYYPGDISAEDKPVKDFGAESIESDDPLFEFDAPIPLPVELVEERSKPSQKNEQEPSQVVASIEREADERDDARQLPGEIARKTTVLNVQDVDIATLVKTFSKLTKRNYIVDSNVKGKVTIYQPTEVTMAEALRIFDTVLLLKGFTTVPVQDNVWKVVPAKDARQTTIPLIPSSPEKASDVLVTQLVRLRHTQAADMQQLLSQFISKDGLLNAFSGTNALIMIDSAANIKRLKKLINKLDVPALDQDITIIPILHAEANDIAEKIKEILGEEEAASSSRTSNRRTATTARRTNTRTNRRTTAARTPTNRSVERRALPLRIIPDERTNSVIVVADPELTAKVKALVERLDSPLDRSGGRFYVYRLQHADSEALSEILTNLISGANESTESSRGTSGSSISRSRAQQSNTNAATQRATALRNRLTSVLARNRRLGSQQSEGKVNLEGEVSIAPDPSTNSLIINASRTDYNRLKEVIEALDVKRRQVLVEATILEVSLNRDEGMGVELQGTAAGNSGGVFGQTNFGGLTNVLTNPTALSDLTIAAASTGTLTLPGGVTIPSQALLISALSRLSNVNVLSSPNILATDNEEAEIIVGENVPFVTSTSTDPSNLGNTFNQIERQDVGITLRITPQISTGDFVMLNIFVEISNVVAGTRNDPNGPTTTIRTTETTVEVKNGQMVVTGGLIQDSVTESSRGVPFLQDIPVFGNYFRRDDNIQRRTNLLLFITPKIITDQFDARSETKSLTKVLEGEIIKGGVQPDRLEVLHNERIDKVAETLPSSKKIRTPITPPSKRKLSLEEKNAIARTKARLDQIAEQAEAKLEKSKDSKKVIDLQVKPKLPGETKPAKKPKMTRAVNNAAQTYVVLRELDTKKTPAPFRYADAHGTVGIILLGDIGSSPSRFFEVGRRYKFAEGGQTREFVCLGKYGSAKEAGVVHKGFGDNGSWHRLSAQQTLLLGKKSWLRG